MDAAEKEKSLKHFREIETNVSNILKSMCEALSTMNLMGLGHEFKERQELAIAELEESLKKVRSSIKILEETPTKTAE
jgi:hypothetical protein